MTADLDGAVDWFIRSFGAVNSGGGPISESYAVPSGGRNAYVRFGQVEAEIIEPSDRGGLTGGALTMHHVGYVVADIDGMKRCWRTRVSSSQQMSPSPTCWVSRCSTLTPQPPTE